MRQVLNKLNYTYSVEYDFLIPNGSGAQTILVEPDSDFELNKLTHFVIADNGENVDINNVPIPAVSVDITDLGSGRKYFESPLPINNLFGTNIFPYILSTKWIWPARSRLLIEVFNFGIAAAYTFNLNFIGKKIFYREGV